MKLKRLMAHLQVSESKIDRIAELLLSNSSLSQATEALGGQKGCLSESEVYALASAYSEDVFGEQLPEMAPKMAAERYEALKKEQPRIREYKMLRRQHRFLSEVNGDLDMSRKGAA